MPMGDDSTVVNLELPGVAKGDVAVDVRGTFATVRAIHRHPRTGATDGELEYDYNDDYVNNYDVDGLAVDVHVNVRCDHGGESGRRGGKRWKRQGQWAA